jgi:hypothetical protein
MITTSFWSSALATPAPARAKAARTIARKTEAGKDMEASAAHQRALQAR